MKAYRSSPSSDMWTTIDEIRVEDHEVYHRGNLSQIYPFDGNLDKAAERKTEFGVAFDSDDVVALVTRNIHGLKGQVDSLTASNDRKDEQISRLEELLENIERIAENIFIYLNNEDEPEDLTSLFDYVKDASLDIQQLSGFSIRFDVSSRSWASLSLEESQTPLGLPKLLGEYDLNWNEELWAQPDPQMHDEEPATIDQKVGDSPGDGDTGVFVDIVHRDSDLELKGESALAAAGYRVGKTSGLSESQRRELLSDFFEYELDSSLIERYGEVVGSPWSGKRLSYIASMIAYHVRMRKLNDPEKYVYAIEDWETDLAFLKETYFDGGYWPSTEV